MAPVPRTVHVLRPLAVLLAALLALLASAGPALAADTTPPGPVTNLTATSGIGKITLRWTLPSAADLAGVLVVRRTGSTPPTAPTNGVQVARVATPGTASTDVLLEAGTAYAYTVYAYDKSRNASPATTVTATTSATVPAVVLLPAVLTRDISLTTKMAKLFLIDGTLTVPAGRTLNLGPGITVKARYGFTVAGTLRTSSTTASRALVTSLFDDTVGGDTPGTIGTPADNPFTIGVQAGGQVLLGATDLRWARLWDYDAGVAGGALFKVTTSLLTDSRVELGYGGTATTLTGNSFIRSNLYLFNIDRPVVTGNSFTDGLGLGFGWVLGSPVYVTGIGDLSGFGTNTATGTPEQRVFMFIGSRVRGTWTLQPSTNHVYGLNNITIEAGGTATMTAGSLSKAVGNAFNVAGTLTSTGTADQRATLTSLYDDTLGGDTGGTGTPADNPYDISLLAGGTVGLDKADLRFGRLWDYHVFGGAPGTVTLTGTALYDNRIELGYGGTATTLTGNSFIRSNLYLFNIDRPVVTGNSFTDGLGLDFGIVPGSPVYVTSIGDLSGIGTNTATGSPEQRLFVFVSSNVRGTWTLQPSTNHVYSLNDITVDDGATLMSLSGAEIRSADTLRVVSGGTLSAEGTTFAALTGQSYPGIDVLAGATATFTDSVFTGATIAVEANPDWALVRQYAEVSISGSLFFGNGFDVFNGPKDVPWGSAVDADGAVTVSLHWHTCVPPPAEPPLPYIERLIWDVEGDGRQDDPECPTGYNEVTGHP